MKGMFKYIIFTPAGDSGNYLRAFSSNAATFVHTDYGRNSGDCAVEFNDPVHPALMREIITLNPLCILLTNSLGKKGYVYDNLRISRVKVCPKGIAVMRYTPNFDLNNPTIPIIDLVHV